MPFEYGIKQQGTPVVTIVDSAYEALKGGPENAVRKFYVHGEPNYNQWIPLIGALPHSNHGHRDGLGQEIFEGAYVTSTVNKLAELSFLQVVKTTTQRVKAIDLKTGREKVKSPKEVCVVPTELVEG